MAASELTVRKRVTEILNACVAGTFSEAVDSSHYDRNSQAIQQAVKEAALAIARAIVGNPNHSHRGNFVSATPTTFTHGDELPPMAADLDIVEIQSYSDGPWNVAVTRDVQQIESYRNNPNQVYSTLDHTTEGSPLSGYYALASSRIYFTGHAARGFFPTIDLATVGGLIPDEYEPTWVSLAVGMTPKEGDNLLPIAQYYLQIGMQDLALVNAMGTVRPTPSPEAARQVRGNA
jgi:hypothetical protein